MGQAHQKSWLPPPQYHRYQSNTHLPRTCIAYKISTYHFSNDPLKKSMALVWPIHKFILVTLLFWYLSTWNRRDIFSEDRIICLAFKGTSSPKQSKNSLFSVFIKNHVNFDNFFFFKFEKEFENFPGFLWRVEWWPS